MTYLPWAQLRSNAFHEVGHYFLARDCGLAVPTISIDAELARRESGEYSHGFCSIPTLDRAPIADQVVVLRAGLVAAAMGGFPYVDGCGGDFDKESRLTKHFTGDEQRALVASATYRAETVLRAHWPEVEAMVERLVREKTIRFDSPASTRRVPWSERRAELDARYGREL